MAVDATTIMLLMMRERAEEQTPWSKQ